jgi:hypothetical protein
MRKLLRGFKTTKGSSTMKFSLPTDSKITRGISVMNIPIGTDEYIQNFLQSKLDEISKDITTIMQVE